MDEPGREAVSKTPAVKLAGHAIHALITAPLLVLWAWTAARDLFPSLPPMEWWHPWALYLGFRVVFRTQTRD